MSAKFRRVNVSELWENVNAALGSLGAIHESLRNQICIARKEKDFDFFYNREILRIYPPLEKAISDRTDPENRLIAKIHDAGAKAADTVILLTSGFVIGFCCDAREHGYTEKVVASTKYQVVELLYQVGQLLGMQNFCSDDNASSLERLKEASRQSNPLDALEQLLDLVEFH